MKTKLFCENCTSEFSVVAWRSKIAKCCSLKCWNILQSKEKNSLIPNPRYSTKGIRKKKWIFIQCKQCSKSFEIPPSHYGRRLFCLPQCQFKWRSIHVAGSKNPNWVNGIRNKNYPSDFFSIRNAILNRDENSCAFPMCRTNDSRVHVHHIDYDKNNSNPMNLICACPSCNARANFQRIFWHSFLSKYNRWRLENGEIPSSIKRGDVEVSL